MVFLKNRHSVMLKYTYEKGTGKKEEGSTIFDNKNTTISTRMSKSNTEVEYLGEIEILAQDQKKTACNSKQEVCSAIPSS